MVLQTILESQSVQQVLIRVVPVKSAGDCLLIVTPLSTGSGVLPILRRYVFLLICFIWRFEFFVAYNDADMLYFYSECSESLLA
jgi:hypothetical protein